MHWRAVYFNRKRAECCFFDSLVSEPTEDVMRGIIMIMRKIESPLYFKFKINRIKLQADNTATCGAFALRFIADMYAGKMFKEAHKFKLDVKKYKFQIYDLEPSNIISCFNSMHARLKTTYRQTYHLNY